VDNCKKGPENTISYIVFLKILEKADCYVIVTPKCYKSMVFSVYSMFARAWGLNFTLQTQTHKEKQKPFYTDLGTDMRARNP
jgi:hypothetical protein